MKLTKEKIAFGVVVLVLGGMAWMELGDDDKKPRRRRGGSSRLAQVDAGVLEKPVPAYALLGEQEFGWNRAGRNVYLAPSEFTSLPPIALLPPPRPTLPVSAPMTIPGPDVFQRVDRVKPVNPVSGVSLPDREGSSVDDIFAEADPEEVTTGDEAVSNPVKRLIGDKRILQGLEDMEGIPDNIKDMIKDRIAAGDTNIEFRVMDANGNAITSDALKSLVGGVRFGNPQEQDAKKKRPTAAERRVKSLEERLKKKTIERIEEERVETAKAEQSEEFKEALDKLQWAGETWYGQVLNDTEKKAGQSGFDRYQIKLRIDAIRGNDDLAEPDKQEQLKSRDLEVEFRRWRKGKFDRKQKVAATNLQAIEFGNDPIHAFEVARRQTPLSDHSAHIALAQELVNVGLHQRAVRHLLELRDAGADSREFYDALADASHRAFDYDVEMEAVMTGLKKFDEDADLLAARGEIQSRLGLVEMADKDFKRALELDDASATVHARYGRHLLYRGGHLRESSARAVKALKKALDRRFRVEADRAATQSLLITALYRAGEVDAARRLSEDVNRVRPNDESGLIGLGVAAYLSGDFEEAKKRFNEALEENPLNGSGYFNLGLCHLEAKEWREARDSLLDAAEADPLLTARAMQAVGFLHEKIGDPSAAQTAYLKALEADPSDPEIVRSAGRGYLLAGDHEQAENYFRQALAAMPGEFELLMGLAETSFNLGRHEDALRYTDSALTFSEDADDMHLRRAQILMRLNRAEEAKVSLDRAKKIRDSKRAEVGFAHYYYTLGNFDEALKRFRSVAKRFEEQSREPMALYVRKYEAEIADNLEKQVWTDHFNRAATAGDLLREWRSYAPGSGIQVSLVDNKVVLRGKQRQSEVCSSVFQQRQGKKFVSFEAALEADPSREFTAGIAALVFRAKRGNQNTFVDSFSGGLAFEGLIVGMTPEGRLCYRVVAKYELGPWQPVSGAVWPRATAEGTVPIRLGIEVDDGKKGTYRILVNGESAVSGIEVKGLQRAGRDMQLWAFTQAEIDKRVELKVDDVRIVTRKDGR